MQTSSFLGQSLKRSTPIQPTQAPRVAPVQAFFKKAEKEVKKAAPKGNATQVSIVIVATGSHCGIAQLLDCSGSAPSRRLRHKCSK